MAAKTKKIEREFLITDSSVNCYGFRLLTKGYQLAEFEKNPIGYYMHDREKGVIVKWEDLRKDGDAVYGKPVINLSNERGQQCVDEIDGHFLNGASVGHIVALEWSEDPKDMLPGQTGPTITKWYNREASLCDVPGNMNALALFDKDGNVINLADFKTTKTILDMKEIKLTAAQLTLIPGLKAEATQEDVNASLSNLAAEAAKVPQLTQDLAAANTAKQKAIDDLAALKATTVKESVETIIATALVEKRMTKEASEQLKKDYATNPDGLKALVAAMKPYESVLGKVAMPSDDKELAGLAAKSGEELYKEGKLERLKELDAPTFLVKAKEAFGKDWVPAEEAK